MISFYVFSNWTSGEFLRDILTFNNEFCYIKKLKHHSGQWSVPELQIFSLKFVMKIVTFGFNVSVILYWR